MPAKGLMQSNNNLNITCVSKKTFLSLLKTENCEFKGKFLRPTLHQIYVLLNVHNSASRRNYMRLPDSAIIGVHRCEPPRDTENSYIYILLGCSAAETENQHELRAIRLFFLLHRRELLLE